MAAANAGREAPGKEFQFAKNRRLEPGGAGAVARGARARGRGSWCGWELQNGSLKGSLGAFQDRGKGLTLRTALEGPYVDPGGNLGASVWSMKSSSRLAGLRSSVRQDAEHRLIGFFRHGR